MKTIKSNFLIFICLFCYASAYSQFTPNAGTPAHYYSTYPSARIGVGSAFSSSVGPTELLHIKNGNLKVENSISTPGGIVTTSYLLGETMTAQLQTTARKSILKFDGVLSIVNFNASSGLTTDYTYLGPQPLGTGEVGLLCKSYSNKDMVINNGAVSNLILICNNANRIIVDPNGKVNIPGQLVIGNVVSADASKPSLSTDYKLYIEKGLIAEKVKTAVNNTTDWADHVFATDYKLRSISEMEKYVLEYKHLPGVPSAEQVVKEGIDMAKMDAKLLEKIEEMALYIIQLKKENEAIKEEMKSIKISK